VSNTKKELMLKNYLGLIIIFASTAFAAQPISFTYQGKALNAAGTSPLLTTVSFTLSISDPSGACLLYQETQSSINLSTTNGLFALQVGSNVGDPKRTTGVDPGLTMSQVFANAPIQLVPASGSCTSGYTPAVGDTRKLHVIITPSTGSPITISPDLSVNAVPNAMVADTVQGLTPTQLLVPAGMILPFGGATCPTNYIPADGTSYARVGTYANLFAAVGSAWGTADSAHFNAPDMRGVSPRGVDGAAGRDPDKASRSAFAAGGNSGPLVGTYEGDMYASHNHGFTWIASSTSITGSNVNGAFLLIDQNGGNSSGGGIQAAGGNESRGKNAYVTYCVKY
jgi:microcystin-dependent protein